MGGALSGEKFFSLFALAETGKISDGASAVLASKAASSRNDKADPRRIFCFMTDFGLRAPKSLTLENCSATDGKFVGCLAPEWELKKSAQLFDFDTETRVASALSKDPALVISLLEERGVREIPG